MVSWFKENFPNFYIIEVTNIGTSSFRTDAGTINTVCVITEDFDVYYHIIKTFPETISLDFRDIQGIDIKNVLIDTYIATLDFTLRFE